MKTSVKTLLIACLAGVSACTSIDKKETIEKEGTTTIRLFEGDNPDPSIVRYKDTYYMVHSSFILL